MQKPVVESPAVSALVDLLDGLKRVTVDFADQLPAAISTRVQQLIDNGLYEAAKARFEAHVRAAGMFLKVRLSTGKHLRCLRRLVP